MHDAARVVRCWCGKLYRVYDMMVGDQSKCPECRRAEREAADRPSTPAEKSRRARRYGGP